MYLNKTQAIVKMLVQGQHTTPFIASTLPPMFQTNGGNQETIINLSRQVYGRPREMVAKTLELWLDNRIPVPKLALLAKVKPTEPDQPSSQ